MAIPEEGNALCNGTAHTTEENRVHPAKVRVKFIESQHVTQVTCAPPSPDCTFDSIMTSPLSLDHTVDYVTQISHESGIDNPFRPDGELSREADTIVSLIKEGKPITPVKSEEAEAAMDGVLANGYSSHDQTDSMLAADPASPNGREIREVVISANSASESKSKPGANGTKSRPVAPGIVEVQHSHIGPPSEAPAVEQVVIKKKPKCHCCVVQ